jgi:hypothetical protein
MNAYESRVAETAVLKAEGLLEIDQTFVRQA